MIIYYLILLFIHYLDGVFTPNTADYDAYGLKLAMNNIFLVEAQNGNNPPTFQVQFAPYINTNTSLQCSMSYPDTIYNYIYTVAVGKNSTQFFFIGELINGKNGTFIGVVKYDNTLSTCQNSFSFFVQYIYNYEHQEYYILGVEPKSRFAYGFSNKFICIFDSENTSAFTSWNGNLTWPDSSFIPHAIDISGNFGIITGFIRNPIDSTAIYIPIIYLINFNSSNNRPFIIDQYQPNATVGTWQDMLTNSNADIYTAQYDMSVSINEYGNILVGMQFINRVFLFSVNITNPIKLIYISRNTNGRSLGNGKGVAWLENGIAAILVNTYLLNYQWLSSQIYFYDIQTNGYNSNSTPLSVFPNNHQLLPQSFSTILLNIISSPSSLALIDNQGNILIINPTAPGYYPFVEDIGSMVVFTSPKPCLPGTYKNHTGIDDCSLCPNGTKNPGNSSINCTSCLSTSFCSLGSVNEIPQSALETISQAIAYPMSPESTIFDEILIQNIFAIGACDNIVVSPLFWTLILAGLVGILIVTIKLSKLIAKNPRTKKIRLQTEYILKHIDLIGDGELWVGGLASLCIIVLVCFAYSFSARFYNQYPIEKTSVSNFACDSSIRNVKFQTNLQLLSIPVTPEAQKMFDLLYNQTFSLNIDFINTLIGCDAVSIQGSSGTVLSTLRWSNCTNENSILSLSIPLPSQQISVQVLLDDIKTIGALRIGLSGEELKEQNYDLKELNFYQSFFKYGKILAQNLPINIYMTKNINQTLPMTDEETDFSGIYIPSFPFDSNNLFLTNDEYIRSSLSSTTLSIVLSETPYYVQNLQQPIAKSSEIVFHNVLFTVVCLEIFGLTFLLHKLIIQPIHRLILREYCFQNEETQSNKDDDDSDNNNIVETKNL